MACKRGFFTSNMQFGNPAQLKNAAFFANKGQMLNFFKCWVAV